MTELYIELCLTLLKRCLDLPGQPEITLKDFKSLPEDRHRKFLDLCKIAYGGICDQRVIFHNLDSSLEHFGFLDQVPSLRGGGAISYNFLHLTLQELLAAYHISQLSIDKQNIAEHQKGELWNIVMRFVAGLTKSVPKFHPLNLVAELILCLYEAQCSADYASLFGEECSLEGEHSLIYGGDTCEPLQAYALGYCIANSNASWKNIKLSGGIALDSLVWGVRSIKSCGGGIRDMEICVYEGEQLATNHFKDAPLTGLSSLICSGVSDIFGKISHAIPAMTRLEELHISNVPDNFRLSNLLLQLVSSNVKKLTLSHLTNEEFLQDCCSALQQLREPSSSGKLVELKLCIRDITASELLNIILGPSSLLTVTLDLRNVFFLNLPATCTNNNVAVLTHTGESFVLILAEVVVDLMERNRAL